MKNNVIICYYPAINVVLPDVILCYYCIPVPPLFVIEFLHRVIHTFEDYFPRTPPEWNIEGKKVSSDYEVHISLKAG